MVAKLQLSDIPQNPGVYFFRDKNEKILYIGKAANLRARLSSYFAKTVASKTGSLIMEAENVTWEILNSEIEALIKEAELIKRHRPKYNVLMRDDKQYFYVAFTKEKYPRIFVTHQSKDHSTFIGPFTEGGALRSVLKTLRRAFPYCTCKNPHKQPCLNAKLGKCLGFCCLDKRFAKRAELKRSEFLALNPLSGGSDASPNSKRLRSLRSSSQTSLVANESARLNFHKQIYNKNISAIKKILTGKNRTLMRQLKKEMEKFSKAQKYEEAGFARDKVAALQRIFEHRGVIKRDLPSDAGKALRSLEAVLGIEGIKRIEAYDIANIQGQFAYGSMAVWENGSLKKDDYRIFKIKSVEGSNDPASISEVLSRRFNHPEWQFPEVIIIDGGIAQLNAALEAQKLSNKNALPHSDFLPENLKGERFSERVRASEPPERGLSASETESARLNFQTSKIIALTKNKRHVGNHILINEKKPIPLDTLPQSLKNLILHLDAEAHRFAIKHYRNLHRKEMAQK